VPFDLAYTMNGSTYLTLELDVKVEPGAPDDGFAETASCNGDSYTRNYDF